MPDTHPDFDAAPAAQRWTRPLAALIHLLRIEAAQDAGSWAWRILRGGAVVAVRLRADLGYDVRIARRETPTTDRGWALWQGEIDTFRREFGIEHWEVRDDPGASGVAVILSEPTRPRRPGEVMPGDLFGEPPARRAPSAIEQGR